MSGQAPYTLIDGIKCYHPALAEDERYYPESGFDLTDKVEGGSFWVRSRTRVLRRQVLRLTRGAARVRMLEIGCGTGWFLRSLSGRENLELVGSEVSLRGLKSATARGAAVEFIQLDATDIPFVGEFDLIGAFDVIEHIDNDMSVLRGMLRALKPGGHAIVTVPQHPFLWSALDEIVHHKRRYTRRELSEKLEAAGFELVYVTSFLFTLFPLMLVSRLLDRGRPQGQDPAAFGKRVSFPGWMNALFDAFMRVDETLIGLGVPLPFGGSLLAVARRKA